MDEPLKTPEVVPSADKASGKAITSLVLGILGLLCCGPLAIVAWILGAMELSDIKKGLSSKAGEGMAKAGMIIGIIGTVLMVLGILVWIAIMAMGIMAGVAEQGGSY
ncbi:MAG: DUF4190 domain-containing protein [Candidatus Aureabacteria bacterium]|nr:DUF4190 domain-containing protein [Candidatus Auribacterota bacterium]